MTFIVNNSAYNSFSTIGFSIGGDTKSINLDKKERLIVKDYSIVLKNNPGLREIYLIILTGIINRETPENLTEKVIKTMPTITSDYGLTYKQIFDTIKSGMDAQKRTSCPSAADFQYHTEII